MPFVGARAGHLCGSGCDAHSQSKVPERLIKLSTPYIAHAHVWLKSHDASAKPTLWEETLLLGAGPTGERSGPPPRLAVEGRSNGHGPMLPISDVTYVKPMLLPHGGWPMAAGPVSRLGSFEPGDKTGLRL